MFLDKDYWNDRYLQNDAGWDIGEVSAPMKAYIDSLNDKNISILIPGCGNAYEAEYLMQQGFTDVTLIDFSQAAVDAVTQKLSIYIPEKLKVIYGDFFDHDGKYDLILEQTFLSALHTSQRDAYVKKMPSLLNADGKLAGVIFGINFPENPPFGGTKEEYVPMFEKEFFIKKIEECYNSIAPRKGNELFIEMVKK